MTFLQLARAVHLLLRIGEDAPGAQPATVDDQSGVMGEIVEYVRRSHADICRLHKDWLFMQGAGEATLATGARTITKAALIALYPALHNVQPFVSNDFAYLGIRPQGEGAEQVVVMVPYQDWRGNYDAPPLATGMPQFFTITPDGDLEFGAIADRNYLLRFMYRKRVTDLIDDDDVPMFDEDYHQTIVWWAVSRYYCATRDGTIEMRNKAEIELRRELTRMRNDLLPDFTLS